MRLQSSVAAPLPPTRCVETRPATLRAVPSAKWWRSGAKSRPAARVQRSLMPPSRRRAIVNANTTRNGTTAHAAEKRATVLRRKRAGATRSPQSRATRRRLFPFAWHEGGAGTDRQEAAKACACAQRCRAELRAVRMRQERTDRAQAASAPPAATPRAAALRMAARHNQHSATGSSAARRHSAGRSDENRGRGAQRAGARGRRHAAPAPLPLVTPRRSAAASATAIEGLPSEGSEEICRPTAFTRAIVVRQVARRRSAVP